MEYGLWISNKYFEFLSINFFHHDLRKSCKKQILGKFKFSILEKLKITLSFRPGPGDLVISPDLIFSCRSRCLKKSIKQFNKKKYTISLQRQAHNMPF